MFATTLCAVLDVDARTLILANAGQTPPILWRAGGEPEFVRMAGLPLGARSQATYEEHCLTLQPGDLCIFTSDGLLDAASPRAYDELRERLQAEARRSPDALLDALYNLSAEVEADDRTALVLSWQVWPAPEEASVVV
jgi:serine phosphatase RsbU (regulator of sigma subunit)